jgi:DNA-binding CsgD family transcriptional regulator
MSSPRPSDRPVARADHRFADVDGGPADHLRVLEGVFDALLFDQGALAEHPASLARLVQAALEAGDWRRAERLIELCEARADEHPELPGLTLAAAHARGVRDRDPALVEQAAACATDVWSHASAAEDAGVLHEERRELQAAVEQLADARDGYERAGAQRDLDRVRARLRFLGVRDGHGRYPVRPPCGRAGLTDTESRIADLVAQGLTNRQVADQTFLSPHTVAFHLRRVYRKMGVASRVELTRVLVDTGTPGEAVEDVRRLRAEVDRLRAVLASQAPIEQAKGALAVLGGWAPEESSEHLVRISRGTKTGLRDAAVEVLAVAVRSDAAARPDVVDAVRAEVTARRPAQRGGTVLDLAVDTR